MTTTDCPACEGSGVIVFSVAVYEHGCGYSHASSDEFPCLECAGSGLIDLPTITTNLHSQDRVPDDDLPF